MIKGMDQLSYMERLERLHLWTLEERRNRSDLIEVFKIIKGYSKCEISDFFIMDNRCKGTRGHSAKLITRSPPKARFGRPYGKNSRLGGHIGETGSRNTAATQKINSLTLLSYSLLQTVFR